MSYWNPEPTVGLWMADCCASSVYRVKTNVVWRGKHGPVRVSCGSQLRVWMGASGTSQGRSIPGTSGTQLGDMPSCEQGGSRIYSLVNEY